jgi:hypothetical protein
MPSSRWHWHAVDDEVYPDRVSEPWLSITLTRQVSSVGFEDDEYWDTAQGIQFISPPEAQIISNGGKCKKKWREG